jgi:hypothetical protein
MINLKCLGGQLGIALCSVLLGWAAHGQPAVSVNVSVPVPTVELEIHAESDFYEPLTAHGEWVVVGSYGRVWRPGNVERSWRPYCHGHWRHTSVGWYWVSDEPWAWATYHYGRWDFAEQHGWYWVPQTQWAPAWVSWHEGGGYVGWAPLHPTVTISVGGFVGFNQARVAPGAFVFVKQGQFLDPIGPSVVIVNNTTIIKQTVLVSNTKVVNNVVVNGGPARAGIEKATGRKVQEVPVRELRQKEEAPVAAKQRANQGGKAKAAPAATETKPGTKSDANRPAPTKESAPAQPDKPSAKPEAPGKPSDPKSQPPGKAKRSAPEKKGSSPADPKGDKNPKQ